MSKHHHFQFLNAGSEAHCQFLNAGSEANQFHFLNLFNVSLEMEHFSLPKRNHQFKNLNHCQFII